MDSAALFLVAGRARAGLAQQAHQRPAFEAELQVAGGQHHRAGRGARPPRALRAAWTRYRGDVRRLHRLRRMRRRARALLRRALPALPRGEGRRRRHPRPQPGRDGAQERPGARQQPSASNTLMVRGRAGGAALLGPPRLGALDHARAPAARRARRRRCAGSAQGDYAVRARRRAAATRSPSSARDFNTMAERPAAATAQSSLGELLQAQQAAQAAIDSLPDPVVVFEPGRRVLNVNRAAEAMLRPVAGVGRRRARRGASGGPRACWSACARTCWPARAPTSAAGLRGGGARWTEPEGDRVAAAARQPGLRREGRRRRARPSCSRTSRGCGASTS